jgi:dihydrofolate synthase/folylpolyglutamate synthase
VSGHGAFEAAIERLMSLTDLRRGTAQGERRTYRAPRMRALLQQLGNPHLAVPTIHVAGTNGKGSTAAMIASILTSAGLRVGLFTSPHLHSVVERIRVGLNPISREQFAALFARVWPAAQAVARHGGFPGQGGAVTTLELLTAMGFHHFREVGAAFQVVEAFVGGRDDTTNIVQPVLSVITNISRDHIPALGTTLLDIARAKAGIIKPGVPVVAAPQLPSVHSLLARTAARQGAAADLLPRAPQRVATDPLAQPCQELRWRGRHGEYRVALPLRGSAQRENAAVAITAAERLIDLGAPLTDTDIRRGLQRVTWPARFELLQRRPVPVVADGAHCPRAMGQLVAELRRVRPRPRLLPLVGGQQGHHAVATLRPLHPLAAAVIVVRSRHPRALPATELAAALQAAGVAARASTLPVADTLHELMAGAGRDELILATGSLAVAAEAREALDPAIEADHYPGA